MDGLLGRGGGGKGYVGPPLKLLGRGAGSPARLSLSTPMVVSYQRL